MFASMPLIRSLARHGSIALSCAVACLSLVGCSDEDNPPESATNNLNEADELSFFVTSTTQDGNLGGLSGADEKCQDLAEAADAGDKTWRAYLSAANGGTPIHAKDRIGEGPWYNANGMMLAADLTALHALTGNPDLFVDENGAKINGQWNGTPPNEHDIMTGSDSTGSLLMGEMQTTCNDWTSNTLQPGPQVGHTDGMGPMMANVLPNHTSWNGGHPAAGCSTMDLNSRGGAGRFYCFASN
jgi:hypothetical protein